MTIRKLMKIIEVVTNGGTVIVDKSTNEFSSFDEITEFSEIEDVLEYDKNGYDPVHNKYGQIQIFPFSQMLATFVEESSKFKLFILHPQ